MVINEKGLCAAMKAAYKKKSTGYKVAVKLNDRKEEEVVISAPGWVAIIARENAPRKVLGLIVEHVGDLPGEGEAYQVQDTTTQAEIFSMAIYDHGNPVAGAVVKRTPLNYNGYQIWQRTDNQEVFMMDARSEDLLDAFNRNVVLTENGMFRAAGVASELYIRPLQVKQNELLALHHLAKLQWV